MRREPTPEEIDAYIARRALDPEVQAANRRAVEEIEAWKRSVRAHPPDPSVEFRARFALLSYEQVRELYALARTGATEDEIEAFWSRVRAAISN